MKHQEDTSYSVTRDAVGLRHDERSSVGNTISFLPSSCKVYFRADYPEEASHSVLMFDRHVVVK